MGWSGTPKHMWGDEPQDEMDMIVQQGWGNVHNKKDYSGENLRAISTVLRSSKTHRAAIDKIYRKAWGRPATKPEYNNLVNLALGLGGKSVRWGPRKYTRRKKAGSIMTIGLPK
jgi:hypothetical protein